MTIENTIIDKDSQIEVEKSNLLHRKLQKFKKCYIESYGMFSHALGESDLTRVELAEFFSDSEWKNFEEETAIARDDFVEYMLLELIKDGESSAIIFYCSTKMKDRGYKK